jgi:hypothetical protein
MNAERLVAPLYRASAEVVNERLAEFVFELAVVVGSRNVPEVLAGLSLRILGIERLVAENADIDIAVLSDVHAISV